jgi:hypothetical protein
MKLQDQVCTREQSTTLKALEIAQETPFSWLDAYSFPVLNAKFSPHNPIACYTTAELGEMLTGHGDISMTSWRNNTFNIWQCEIDRPDPDDPLDFVIIATTEATTEAAARAAALIYLLEKQVITADHVNARLNAQGGDVE